MKLIGPFTQILTFAGLPSRGPLSDDQLMPIKDGGILVQDGNIVSVGLFKDLQSTADTIERVDNPAVCIPGLIDAHTHICFGGNRANDYALRNAGKTYLEIAKAGGGIWDTVTKTRIESENRLIENILEKSNQHLKNGVTTIEVKSGYGLSVKEELKQLRAIKKANEKLAQDLVSTCLAAHMVPKDHKGNAKEYLEEISADLLPVLQEEKLSHRIDAFVEESAFSPKQILPYLIRAKEMKFDITIHADQFSTGGSEVAVSVGAVSADHLEASQEKEINRLAHSNTVSVALPGASIGLGCPFAPARKLLDAGAILAIASDHNPGSAPMGHLLLQAAILGSFESLTNAEVLTGITSRAALALNLRDRGVLKAGMKADFIVFPTKTYQEITYFQGQLTPSAVYCNGKKEL